MDAAQQTLRRLSIDPLRIGPEIVAESRFRAGDQRRRDRLGALRVAVFAEEIDLQAVYLDPPEHVAGRFLHPGHIRLSERGEARRCGREIAAIKGLRTL